ncbi:ATP-dependent 6-phosphofructokinase [Desulfobacca acetoxidans]|uniref:ATP-dependent 6-phosphofructokinase n=1 Tax=Desulfobacca acetoxidans (strain ATCC 700848 / DSM 11109 / ASRB2) TaxID=880072 RepID=F2NE77_DESAR|nr:ATP-dependent 6-phosphofructokinase [Desulfobacca acetoxidans]AEB10707.1 6-phosphofructokinase [Desulfobacca acetoxidans DSM 11109]
MVDIKDFEVETLGECRVDTPIESARFVEDDDHVMFHYCLKDLQAYFEAGQTPPYFEMAGPRRNIYFDPSKLKCGIVTCGGLCPGINDVIQAMVMELYYHYGVRSIFGFRYGFEGLAPKYKHSPLELNPDVVTDIYLQGGTILGSSRGEQNVPEMVDTLERMNLGLLFAIGGDGTLRGAQAISQEIKRRNLKIGVIGIPKTIDNDISYVQNSFGFITAISEARTAIYTAHIEALGARNGIGLVKLMGRESGFIAAYATLANADVNLCLVPESPFSLEGLMAEIQNRLERRSHAVIVVAEGAGQEFFQATSETDASGNVRLGDIGVFLKEKINQHFKKIGVDITLKYIDPSYTIRSVRANPYDSYFCLTLGHQAAHAGMAGRTNMLVGYWNGQFTHMPISLAVSARKRIDPKGRLWNEVLASTGQPRTM